MPRNFKLTWQSGVGKRAGRWRKKYKGKAHYFAGGRGKSDRGAYDAAVAAWEKLKARIDAEAPKPHQAEYERAILEWDVVLDWCRKHNEPDMADTAINKQGVLRRSLSALKPSPVQREDTFTGQFDRSVRYPGIDET
ncbi:MAG: hypothetical protein IH991_11420, partial [Planctomycetes bacterium]|nr:hypothetical protein [Planctomycetota bacterium]